MAKPKKNFQDKVRDTIVKKLVRREVDGKEVVGIVLDATFRHSGGEIMAQCATARGRQVTAERLGANIIADFKKSPQYPLNDASFKKQVIKYCDDVLSEHWSWSQAFAKAKLGDRSPEVKSLLDAHRRWAFRGSKTRPVGSL